MNNLYFANLCKKIYTDDVNYSYLNAQYGYKAGIIKNDELKTYIIVFRGTSNFKNIIEDVELILGLIPSYFKNGEEIYKYAVNLAVKDNYNLIATGHSLGGSVCQYISNKFGIQSITFNPFGVMRSLTNISDLNKAKCTNYCVWGDEVSSIDSSHQYGNCVNLITNEYNSLNLLDKTLKLHSIDTVIKILKEKEVK